MLGIGETAIQNILFRVLSSPVSTTFPFPFPGLFGTLPSTELQKGNFKLRSCPREAGATSSPLWNPTQTKASLVMCTPPATHPAAQGCQNHTQLWLFHTTFQRRWEAFWLPNLLFSGTPLLLHRPRCLWTLEVPLFARYQPVGHICSHPLKGFLRVATFLNCCSPSSTQTPQSTS